MLLCFAVTKANSEALLSHVSVEWFGLSSVPTISAPLKETLFGDADGHIFNGEGRWFEGGVKEATSVHCEQASSKEIRDNKVKQLSL